MGANAGDAEMHARLPASDDPADFGPQDAVIVAVKAPALPRVAARIGPLLRPDTPVVFARAVTRPDEALRVMTLAEAREAPADMATLVIIGASATRLIPRSAGLPFVYTPRSVAAR